MLSRVVISTSVNDDASPRTDELTAFINVVVVVRVRRHCRTRHARNDAILLTAR